MKEEGEGDCYLIVASREANRFLLRCFWEIEIAVLEDAVANAREKAFRRYCQCARTRRVIGKCSVCTLSESEMTGWVIRVSYNAVIDELRKARKMIKLTENFDVPYEDGEEEKDRRKSVLITVGLLKPIYRQVFTLYMEGRKPPQIAVTLDLSLSVVYKRLQRAKAMIIDALKAEYCFLKK